MTYAEIHNAVRSRFESQVSESQSLPTLYDNDGERPPEDNSPWCRLMVFDGDTTRVEVGAPTYRKYGVAIAELYGPVGEGDGGLLTLIDAIVAAFLGVTAGGVRYRTVHAERVGENGGVYQINVVIRYEADHQA